MQIVPAILTNKQETASQALAAYSHLSAEVHVDVKDNTFVKGKTLLPAEFPVFQGLSFAWHLMVNHPLKYLADCLAVPTTVVFVQATSQDSLHEVASQLHHAGVAAGIVLNPTTPSILVNHLLSAFDWVQIMTIEPGQQGTPFIPGPLTKLPLLHTQHPRLKIAIDGGMNPTTIHSVVRYRPDTLVVGSYLAPGPELDAHWRELQQAIQ